MYISVVQDLHIAPNAHHPNWLHFNKAQDDQRKFYFFLRLGREERNQACDLLSQLISQKAGKRRALWRVPVSHQFRAWVSAGLAYKDPRVLRPG